MLLQFNSVPVYPAFLREDLSHHFDRLPHIYFPVPFCVRFHSLGGLFLAKERRSAYETEHPWRG
ncbi:MAG: hypothetical protein HYY10_02315 [Candidatus Liptonbacteria bacterium]|nr:hypothetical protein [Candidatus Liptonbacteria bacterium]